MSMTVLHIRDHAAGEIEDALETIFAQDERARLLRIEGTFSAVRGRLAELSEMARYRYLILRPANGSAWTPVLDLGSGSAELEARLSALLAGSPVFSIFVSPVYGELISGYRLARAGAPVDRYTSDPSILQVSGDDQENLEERTPDEQEAGYEAERGHPERFSDLLPAGTTAHDFSRVVLEPGWWEEHDQAMAGGQVPAGMDPDRLQEDMTGEEEDLVELVDELDRMRCIALALEVWGPHEYPFAQEVEDIPNQVAGPAIALAFA